MVKVYESHRRETERVLANPNNRERCDWLNDMVAWWGPAWDDERRRAKRNGYKMNARTRMSLESWRVCLRRVRRAADPENDMHCADVVGL